jgi:hypothetical protein
MRPPQEAYLSRRLTKITMSTELIGSWIGIIRGTDAGNVFASICLEENHIKLDLSGNIPSDIVHFSGFLETDKNTTAMLAALHLREASEPETLLRVDFEEVIPAARAC